MQRNIMSLFWQKTWQYKVGVLQILLLLTPTVLLHQFLPPLILAGMLGQLASGNYVAGDLWGSFGWSLTLFIILRITSATIIWRAVIYLTWKLEALVTRDLTRQAFGYFMQQSIAFHADHLSGSLVAAATRYTDAYKQLLNATVMQFIPLVLSFLFVVTILLTRAPLYVAFLLCFTAVYIVVTFIGTRKVRQQSVALATAESEQIGTLADNLANIVAIKSFATGREEVIRFNKALDRTYNSFLRMARVVQSRELAFSTVTASITSISIVLSIASVVLFKADIAISFLIIEYTGLLTARLWEFTTGTLRTYNRAVGDASDMTRMLTQTPMLRDPPVPIPARITHGAIFFKDIWFAHAGTKDTPFRSLTLTIAAGEKVGLVGRSGAGKTTLVKLLMRFADVERGAIYIDGQNIAAITQDDLHRHIAYVPQEPALFHRSIKENIAYGRKRAKNKDIIEAAKKAHAHEFITKLPHGYDTLVGERGTKLSGGQRQRIITARAILKNAPILVLDEATSALDSESESAIQTSFANLMHHRTTLVIAHRLSTVQKMDRIIVLDEGKIIEEGSHSDLLKQHGVYAKLWSHQSGELIMDNRD